jgi:hypothetical protein
MIIRKPYAFLVKHYKLIHLLMIIPAFYLVFKSYFLMNFFNIFVSNGYLTKETNIVGLYFNYLLPLCSFIIILISSLINKLLKDKNMEHGVYVFVLVFYSIIFVVSLFLPSILNAYETTDIESSVALMYQGLSSLFFFLQPVIIIALLLSAFGFNIKTFEFNDIKDEFNLDEEDSEEVEINLGVEDYQIKRGFRRYLRELKYYVIENKVIFITLGTILGIIVAIFITSWIISLNRVVRVDQSFTHSKFAISFNDSLLSTLDYNGNQISNDKVYLAIKTTVKNTTKGLLTLNTNDFWLDINNTYYYPILDRSGKFIDLAKPYYGEKIGAGESYEYVFVYELPLDLAQLSYKIKVLDSVTYKENAIIPSYREVTLNPKASYTINNNGEYNMGNTINFGNTTLLNSSLLINSYEFQKSYQYTYQYCYNNNCRDSKNSVSSSANSILLVMDGEIKLDNNCSYYKYKLSNNDFAQDFMVLEYSLGDKTGYLKLKNVTPSSVSDKLILETGSIASNADSLKLIITIRDQRYTYILK